MNYTLIRFFKQLFCFHEWEYSKPQEFNVVRGDNTIEGTVTLANADCSKCGKGKLHIVSRIHYKIKKDFQFKNN